MRHGGLEPAGRYPACEVGKERAEARSKPLATVLGISLQTEQALSETGIPGIYRNRDLGGTTGKELWGRDRPSQRPRYLNQSALATGTHHGAVFPPDPYLGTELPVAERLPKNACGRRACPKQEVDEFDKARLPRSVPGIALASACVFVGEEDVQSRPELQGLEGLPVGADFSDHGLTRRRTPLRRSTVPIRYRRSSASTNQA